MDIKLILPNKTHKKQVEEYKQKMFDANSSMDGCGDLKSCDFDEWLKRCKDYKAGKNLPLGYVPATQYICIRKTDNKLIGMLQIRHSLTEFLLNYGGHIGDSISPDERQKGYGKKMLGLGIAKCKNLGIEKVLITCKDTNAASRKCIIANGGVYEDTRHFEPENINLERYWVKVK